jgi:hypothetical protein
MARESKKLARHSKSMSAVCDCGHKHASTARLYPADGDATGAHEEAAMAYTMEQRMVCAHKQGRMMSIFARK